MLIGRKKASFLKRTLRQCIGTPALWAKKSQSWIPRSMKMIAQFFLATFLCKHLGICGSWGFVSSCVEGLICKVHACDALMVFLCVCMCMFMCMCVCVNVHGKVHHFHDIIIFQLFARLFLRNGLHSFFCTFLEPI